MLILCSLILCSCQYRQRGEARIYETVNQKMEVRVRLRVIHVSILRSGNGGPVACARWLPVQSQQQTRIADQPVMRCQASNEPIVEESKHREQLEAMFDGKIEEEALKFQLEMQEDKKQRHENSKHTMKMFRDAMTKLAEHVDNEATERETAECDLQDKLLQSIGQLSNCIYQEGKVRVESETQMTKLLEDMALKLHDELAREKDDRQNTERVLMGLLDESVEAIALRANNETLGVLQQRRDERERSRAVREDAAANSKDYWTQKFQEEKDAAKQRHMMELEEEKREEAEQLKAVQDLETTLEGT